MTLAFVVGIVGYLVGMLHGRRLLSAPRPKFYMRPEMWDGGYEPATNTVERMLDSFPLILVNTQYNAHPPVS